MFPRNRVLEQGRVTSVMYIGPWCRVHVCLGSLDNQGSQEISMKPIRTRTTTVRIYTAVIHLAQWCCPCVPQK